MQVGRDVCQELGRLPDHIAAASLQSHPAAQISSLPRSLQKWADHVTPFFHTLFFFRNHLDQISELLYETIFMYFWNFLHQNSCNKYTIDVAGALWSSSSFKHTILAGKGEDNFLCEMQTTHKQEKTSNILFLLSSAPCHFPSEKELSGKVDYLDAAEDGEACEESHCAPN